MSAATSRKQTLQLFFYDANIVACAALSGADVLLSEDMQTGLFIDGLHIQNPFIHPFRAHPL